MSDKLLPLAAMEKLLKQGGAERVSDKAKAALKNSLEEIAHEIAAKSIKLAVHAGRKTIKAEDIKLAVKE
ncbi:NFYB/HAP3 family transcription factor subunit [Candidatus Woesearchaeota archaeon]|nr:NFYB/HAP3 family transcription factor subunit [Candidatus Woesearchaeota archaeon]